MKIEKLNVGNSTYIRFGKSSYVSDSFPTIEIKWCLISLIADSLNISQSDVGVSKHKILFQKGID